MLSAKFREPSIKRRMQQRSQTKTRSFDFAVRIVEQYKVLSGERKEFVLSRQLLRSGTSIGANVTEALSSFSSKEYASKFSIARKEAAETIYWLDLLYRTKYLTQEEYSTLYEDAVILMKMISATIITMQKRLGRMET